MRHFKFALLMTSAISMGLSGNALGDGVPELQRSPTLGYDWTGLYAGANVGGIWGSTGAFDNLGYNRLGDSWDADTSGVIAGVQVGYNWQSGPIVFGIEGDIGDFDQSGSSATTFPPVSGDTRSHTESDFYLTARGRLGYVADHLLIYGTAGYIGANTSVSVIDTCNTPPCGNGLINASDDSFRSGWTAGGGMEVALSGRWTVKAEYLYYDFGTKTVSGLINGTGPLFSWDLDTTGNVVRAGVNYRFNGFGY